MSGSHNNTQHWNIGDAPLALSADKFKELHLKFTGEFCQEFLDFFITPGPYLPETDEFASRKYLQFDDHRWEEEAFQKGFYEAYEGRDAKPLSYDVIVGQSGFYSNPFPHITYAQHLGELTTKQKSCIVCPHETHGPYEPECPFAHNVRPMDIIRADLGIRKYIQCPKASEIMTHRRGYHPESSSGFNYLEPCSKRYCPKWWDSRHRKYHPDLCMYKPNHNCDYRITYRKLFFPYIKFNPLEHAIWQQITLAVDKYGFTYEYFEELERKDPQFFTCSSTPSYITDLIHDRESILK
ncbi:hypothetical protein KDA11_05135 [Candidatus Saccharibacteria bacterium]|nr:hypothetical protein [Candidatus Saccharibacteria bacterium]